VPRQVEGGERNRSVATLYEENVIDETGRIVTRKFRDLPPAAVCRHPAHRSVLRRYIRYDRADGAKSMSESPYNPVGPRSVTPSPTHRHPFHVTPFKPDRLFPRYTRNSEK